MVRERQVCGGLYLKSIFVILVYVDVPHPTPKLLWVYCPGHAGVKENNRADRPEGKATITSGLRLGRFEVLRSLRRYLRAHS